MKRKNQGITLIALIITVIVLIILAGVTLNMVFGERGIITKSKQGTEDWKREFVTEEFGTILAERQINNIEGETESLEEYLYSKGADEVIDNEDGTLDVEYKEYIFTVDDDTLKIINVEKAGGVRPEIEITKQVSGDQKTVTITVKVTNEVGTVDSIELYGPDNNQVTGNVDLSGKTATYDVKNNGKYTAKVKATTDGKQKSGRKSIDINDILVEFSTAYGRIEVIWIDQENNVINEPLSPKDSLKGMTPIKWEGTTEKTANPDNTDGWYEYKAGTGKEDNLSSRWANAKNTVDGIDSYFVWIPRYAYRITYYKDENSDVATGYYDGRGMVDTVGNVKNNCTLEEGIETVEKDGKSYIVHPAFMNDYTDDGDDTNDFNLGGWDGDLAGIWVGKYETSHSDATISEQGSKNTIKIQPNVVSWKSGYISTYYDRAKEYGIQDSHMMKNSEWGAVAYLTHSQYGRNGHEIDINNSENFITGNGGGSTNANEAPGVTNAYNTELGQKASSTGNIYGIYDLSGGADEYIATFNNVSDSKNLTKYGGSFASKGGPSTKYATAYQNEATKETYENVYKVGKTGDGTKETCHWFDDGVGLLYMNCPFPLRGGYCVLNSSAGVFQSTCYKGLTYSDWPNATFRVVVSGFSI